MAPKKQQQKKQQQSQKPQSSGGPKLQISAENEQRLRRLLLNKGPTASSAAAPSDESASLSKAQKAKKLKSVYEKLSCEGFSDDQIERALNALKVFSSLICRTKCLVLISVDQFDWNCGFDFCLIVVGWLVLLLSLSDNSEFDFHCHFNLSRSLRSYVQDTATFEAALDWLCLNLSRAELPMKFRDGSSLHEENWTPQVDKSARLEEEAHNFSVITRGGHDDDSVVLGEPSQADWIRQYMEKEEEFFELEYPGS
ncbi:hypothetical protein Cgig2_014898 [Carnegiea gigantea]|uniref:ATP-dependent RNA helicase DHX29-like UBA domain-containing protein n=1 Tax=Carnegiea gigantea TaxID=171969 RepID=A0A9Q1JK46_9CARY|nr:hypothetical protein Cgig2_014898 [Carnegiea gigantea]